METHFDELREYKDGHQAEILPLCSDERFSVGYSVWVGGVAYTSLSVRHAAVAVMSLPLIFL